MSVPAAPIATPTVAVASAGASLTPSPTVATPPYSSSSAADGLGATVRIIPADEWTHGEAKGICEQLNLVDMQPRIEIRDRENDADLARTLVHEYAHALLHFDVDDDTERSKREVEAEAVAYVVGRYCGLDTSGSAFYLAAWESD